VRTDVILEPPALYERNRVRDFSGGIDVGVYNVDSAATGVRVQADICIEFLQLLALFFLFQHAGHDGCKR
jgi:hypothetical protein